MRCMFVYLYVQRINKLITKVRKCYIGIAIVSNILYSTQLLDRFVFGKRETD